jgi:hypothetical protein
MLNMNEAHGTTIQFQTNTTLSKILEATFAPISEECALKNPLDRAGIVFGRDQVEFLYKNHAKPGVIDRLDQYYYFGAPSSQFYSGKSENIVEQWRCDKEDKDRFIISYNEKKFEITQSGRGYSKDPEEVKTNMNGYYKTGNYKIVCGMRLDKTVFDPENPSAISGKFTPGSFNIQHIGIDPLDSKEFLWSMKLVRNNQLIGLIPNPTISLGSMRANDDAQIAGALVQVEIQFNPISSQDNHQDRVTGIQENKNQFDGKGFPVQLARIAGFLRSEKAKQVMKFMNDCIEASGGPSDEERLAKEKFLEAQRLAKEKADAEAKEKAKAKAKKALGKGGLPILDYDDSESDTSSDNKSDVSEDAYITGDDLLASLHELYDTIRDDQKITELDFKNIIDKMRINLFGE